MTGYLMEMASADQIAAEDPFDGRGVFLPMTAAAGDIIDALERVFGTAVQAVAWPERGAWADTSVTGMQAAEMLARWEAR